MKSFISSYTLTLNTPVESISSFYIRLASKGGSIQLLDRRIENISIFKVRIQHLDTFQYLSGF